MIAVPAHKTSERGFALLIVFLMAAAIALMLYAQMPRAAFESERDKEQLLIDRGEQYKRGIQLYLQANRRFPSSLDDLEQRDKRFLRRRYVDPYTGKADTWRLIHSNGQALTDSLVQKPPDPNATQNASTSGTNGADNQPTVNAAVLQRPSDRVLLPLNGLGAADPNNPAVYPGSQIGDPQNPAFLLNGAPTGLQVVPGAPGQPLPGTVSGQPTVNGLPVLQPGVSPGFQVNANGQIIAVGPGGPNGQPGAPGQPGGAAPGNPNAAALNIINTLLTTPRPQQVQQASNPALLQNNNNAIGGGIAGVASSHEGPSIKVYSGLGTYAEQQTYQTWEFIATGGPALGGGGGGGGAPPRTPPTTQPGQPRPPGAPGPTGVFTFDPRR